MNVNSDSHNEKEYLLRQPNSLPQQMAYLYTQTLAIPECYILQCKEFLQ